MRTPLDDRLGTSPGPTYPAWLRLVGWAMTESPFLNRLIEKGQLQQAQADLLLFLQHRFPGPLPAGIAETINTQPSMNLLHDWM